MVVVLRVCALHPPLLSAYITGGVSEDGCGFARVYVLVLDDPCTKPGKLGMEGG